MLTAHLGKLAPASDVAVALNTALMGDGAVIRIAAGSTIARPIHLLFVASEKPAATFTRSLVVVEKGARAMLIESHEGPAGSDYQVNAAVEIFVGDEAHVDHVKLIGEGADALHVSTLAAAIGSRARFNTFTFTAGGAVVRNQLFLNFDGEDTVAGIRGATLIKGKQHADTTLVANHIARGCQSREMFKTVLDGEAHGVFQGRIIVRQGAQKTDAKMMTRALLLSERAEADNKPELEIFADDVQCGHGATAGALDDESEILSHGARYSGGRSRGVAHSRFSRRGDRGHRTCRLARGADGQRRRLAEGARLICQNRQANGAYDVNRIRADFPILATEVYGKPLVYLDNAASAQKPNAVLDRMHQAYTTQYANVHRGLHYLANEATEAYEGAREKVAALPQRQAQGRDHLHPQRHRGDQSRRLYIRPRAHKAGR